MSTTHTPRPARDQRRPLQITTNTKIRVLTRVAFGFRSPEALIAMAMLAVGGCCPALPGRS